MNRRIQLEAASVTNRRNIAVSRLRRADADARQKLDEAVGVSFS